MSTSLAPRGTDSAESDVDLGLLLDQDEPGGELHRFLGDLAARLEAITAPRPTDLVVLNVQGPVFCRRGKVDRSQRVVGIQRLVSTSRIFLLLAMGCRRFSGQRSYRSSGSHAGRSSCAPGRFNVGSRAWRRDHDHHVE